MPTLTVQLRRARGFTLLEVMISILVIAFGLLGIAGLQVFALKNNQSASHRSIATVLAADMIDRIKANPIGADQGHYNKPATSDYPTTDAPVDCTGGCSPANLAARDRYEWEKLVKEALPNGVAIVCRDATPEGTAATPEAPLCDNGTQYAIKIWWTDDRITTNSPTGIFTTQFAR